MDSGDNNATTHVVVPLPNARSRLDAHCVTVRAGQDRTAISMSICATHTSVEITQSAKICQDMQAVSATPGIPTRWGTQTLVPVSDRRLIVYL